MVVVVIGGGGRGGDGGGGGFRVRVGGATRVHRDVGESVGRVRKKDRDRLLVNSNIFVEKYQRSWAKV